MAPIISSLHIYPLKSAQGIELESMELVSTGPRYDREWMLVDKNGNFLSQRSHPQMSQIQTRIDQDHLALEIQNFGSIDVPFDNWGEKQRKVGIFGKKATGAVLEERYSEYFGDFLKSEVYLVRSPKEDKRTTSGNHGPITPIQFADGYPLLMTNEASLKTLSQRLEMDIPMSRFRPNIVIKDAPSHLEDEWKSFKMTDIEFLCAKHCARCAIIDVDPATGQKSKIVSREMKKYRMKDNNILFGINLIHSKEGSIATGHPLTDIV